MGIKVTSGSLSFSKVALSVGIECELQGSFKTFPEATLERQKEKK